MYAPIHAESRIARVERKGREVIGPNPGHVLYNLKALCVPFRTAAVNPLDERTAWQDPRSGFRGRFYESHTQQLVRKAHERKS